MHTAQLQPVKAVTTSNMKASEIQMTAGLWIKANGEEDQRELGSFKQANKQMPPSPTTAFSV